MKIRLIKTLHSIRMVWHYHFERKTPTGVVKAGLMGASSCGGWINPIEGLKPHGCGRNKIGGAGSFE